jgi:hypothetical protein
MVRVGNHLLQLFDCPLYVAQPIVYALKSNESMRFRLLASSSKRSRLGSEVAKQSILGSTSICLAANSARLDMRDT